MKSSEKSKDLPIPFKVKCWLVYHTGNIVCEKRRSEKDKEMLLVNIMRDSI